MMLPRAAILLFLLVTSLSPALANVVNPLDGDAHVNIGVRLAWDTESGDRVIGIEVSYTFREGMNGRDIVNVFSHGAVLNVDFLGGGTRVGLGYEAVTIPTTLGLETGPSLLIAEQGLEVGWHITPFMGFLLFAYDQVTFLPSGTTNEFGFLLKAPIPVADRTLGTDW